MRNLFSIFYDIHNAIVISPLRDEKRKSKE